MYSHLMHRFEKWRDAISLAPDESSVVQVMRDYANAIDLQSLELLVPDDCLKVLLYVGGGATDNIEAAAQCLLDLELSHRDDPVVDGMLHELAHTFAAATARIRRLRTDVATSSG